MSGALWWLCGVATAMPVRRPPARPASIEWEPGRREDVLVVKLVEDAGLEFAPVRGGLRLEGPGRIDGLRGLLEAAEPVFQRDPDVIRADRASFDPERKLADLTLYVRIETPDAAALGTRLLADPRVELVYLEFDAIEPPSDIPPETPDFSDRQGYLDPAPGGFGFRQAWEWPGGTGANVVVADLEYSWDPRHEDLGTTEDAAAWGWNSGYYAYHGNGVLGELFGGHNGYGIDGMVPEALPQVISPYTPDRVYDIAAAVDGAAGLLDAGDVLLIEQQSYAYGSYCPVSASPAVFDAISMAVAKGIVVVEPGGNGAQDLDADYWAGWFDRDVRDSGSIMVGGGASPDSSLPALSWERGSSYGSRVDVQGWYGDIVTATNADYLPDLWFPDNDPLQAYTTAFGGTSGASPMVTAAAAIANSIAIELWGEPWDPWDLRAALVSTGTPQWAEDTHHIGPQPDLRRLLRTWAVR